MRTPITPAFTILVSLALAGPGLAGDSHALYVEGLTAYDGGRYGDAVAAWEAASDADDADAMTGLANMLTTGEGIAPDIDRARRLYFRAAELGDPVAMMSMGDLAATAVERYVWYALAARRGQTWAASQLDRLYAGLGDPDRAAAARAVERGGLSPF